MAIKKSQSKTKVEGPRKHASSEECRACETKCDKGKKHISRLINKFVSKCPTCPLK